MHPSLDNQHGAHKKGNPKAQRIQQQHHNALQHISLAGGKHQSRTQKCADTGRPSYGEDNAEQKGRKKSQIVGFAEFGALEKVDLKNAEKIQTKENDNQACKDVETV